MSFTLVTFFKIYVYLRFEIGNLSQVLVEKSEKPITCSLILISVTITGFVIIRLGVDNKKDGYLLYYQNHFSAVITINDSIPKVNNILADFLIILRCLPRRHCHRHCLNHHYH